MPWRDTQSSRLPRLFVEGFSAMDIAEPLVSFDESTRSEDVKAFMKEKDFDLVGVRRDGLVEGYVRREELVSGWLDEVIQAFQEAINRLESEPTPEMHQRQVPLIDEDS